MPIRLLKASSYYPGYLRWFYAKNPLLREASYAEQHAALMNDQFSLSDAWKRCLEEGGRFEVQEIVVNAEPLQKRWALENKVAFGEKTWLVDIFLSQFGRFSPNVLYAHSASIATRVKDQLKARLGSKLVVICYDGAARRDPRLARHCDLMLTCDEASIPMYQAWGARTHFMHWGFDAHVLPKLRPIRIAPPVSFVGGVSAGHHERACFLWRLAKEIPVDYWLSELPHARQLMKSSAWLLLHGNWDWPIRIPSFVAAVSSLRKLNHGELYGVEMFSVLAASRITLNMHLSVKGSKAGNIRLYEATGTGTCLVTDWKPNLDKLFELDREIVAFRSAEEAEEKIRFLLEHESERQEIARRGQARTLKSHRYGDRVKEVAEIICHLA